MFLFVSNFNLADGFGEFQTGVAPPVVIVFVKKLNNSEDKKSRPQLLLNLNPLGIFVELGEKSLKSFLEFF